MQVDWVECHCGWRRENHLSRSAGTALLTAHHRAVHGLGHGPYEYASWDRPDPSPMPLRIRLFGGRRK